MRYAPTFSLSRPCTGGKVEQDQPTGNIFYVYGFAAVGVFILSSAASTTRSGDGQAMHGQGDRNAQGSGIKQIRSLSSSSW